MGFLGLGKMILFNLFGGIDCFFFGVVDCEGIWVDKLFEGKFVKWCF